MNIDKMVEELIEAQEAIGEPISIVRKTEREDEIHAVCSGSGVELLTLQTSALSDTFRAITADLSEIEVRALKNAILTSIEQSLDAELEKTQPTKH